MVDKKEFDNNQQNNVNGFDDPFRFEQKTEEDKKKEDFEELSESNEQENQNLIENKLNEKDEDNNQGENFDQDLSENSDYDDYEPISEDEDYVDEESDDESSSNFKFLPILLVLIGIFLLGSWWFTRKNKDKEPIITGTGTNITGNINEKTPSLGEDEEGQEDNLGNYIINKENGVVMYGTKKIIGADSKTFEVLARNYAKDKRSVYYKGQKVRGVNPKYFEVIDKNGDYNLKGIVVNSDNLFVLFEELKNREFLMYYLDDVLIKNFNVSYELEKASIYGMSKLQNDYDGLKKYDWGDEMSDKQRAKFAVIYLYMKIMKKYSNDPLRMSQAQKELKYFLENSDKILQKYGPEKDIKKQIQGDIGYDNYCVYNDGKNYACFLNKIFVK